MTKTHNETTCPKLIALDSQCIEGKEYRLYSFETEKTEFYVIYIYDGTDCCAETVFADRQDSLRLFDMICEGKVCCEHLTDIVTDYKHEMIC